MLGRDKSAHCLLNDILAERLCLGVMNYFFSVFSLQLNYAHYNNLMCSICMHLYLLRLLHAAIARVR
jgi:hypothetical protein